MTQPTGVFVRLPLTAEHLNKFQHYRNGGCKPDVVMRSIGTPVTGGELYPVGYIAEDAIGGLATGIYQSASIFRDADKEHHDTVALVRFESAQAAIAALEAESKKYRMLLEQIINRASLSCVRTLSGRESRLLAGACADAREALKGPEA